MTKRRSLTRAQKLRIFRDHGGICHICGLKIHANRGIPWEAEHVVPIWAGGSDTPDNMAPAHKIDCHEGKTSGEATDRAKEVRVAANHLGIPKPGKKLPGGRNTDVTITMSEGPQQRLTGSQKHKRTMALLYPFGRFE